MKRTILLALLCVMFGILGCRKERASQETSAKVVALGELKIQEALKRMSDWRFAHWDDVRRKRTLSTFRDELIRLNDPVRRKKYVKRLADIVFAYPLDATDLGPEVLYYPLAPTAPGTRKEQWFAFCEMSDWVALLANRDDDLDTYWDIVFRRIKRFQEELKNVEDYLDGKTASLKGDRSEWLKYHERVKKVCENYCEKCAYYFQDTRTAYFLDFERWQSIRAQLAKLVGHEVKVWSSVLEYWKKKGKNVQKANSSCEPGAYVKPTVEKTSKEQRK